MSLIKAVKRLEYAKYLIKRKKTGNLEAFAAKMKLSKSMVKELLSQMREPGAKILYDRSRSTYYYKEEGGFCISKFMQYGESLTRRNVSQIGKPEELCFSEKAIFVLCKELYSVFLS